MYKITRSACTPNILGWGADPPLLSSPVLLQVQISKHLPGLIMSEYTSIAAKSIPLDLKFSFSPRNLCDIAASIVQNGRGSTQSGRGRKLFARASRAIGYSAPPTNNIFLRL